MLKYRITFNHREGFMKLLFSFIFLFFLSFQTQAQVLIEYPIHLNMDEFDWQAFTNKENIQRDIYRRNRRFKTYGVKSHSIDLSKIDLVQIEQELELYKRGIKTGLSSERIQLAEAVIALHRRHVNSIEYQINTYAGLGDSVDIRIMEQINGTNEEFYKETWELYKIDHEIVLNMLKKEDQNLYKALGSNDEDYAEFITSYVKRFIKKIQNTTQNYYYSLGREVDYKTTRDIVGGYIKGTFKELNAISITDIYMDSLEIYESFFKNFKNPVGEHQKELMNILENWYGDQVLMGLNYLNVVTDKEQEIYKEFIEEGIIEHHNTDYFSDRDLPIPDVTKKSKKQNHFGSDVYLLDTSS